MMVTTHYYTIIWTLSIAQVYYNQYDSEIGSILVFWYRK
jgi:hypothetical protein